MRSIISYELNKSRVLCNYAISQWTTCRWGFLIRIFKFIRFQWSNLIWKLLFISLFMNLRVKLRLEAELMSSYSLNYLWSMNARQAVDWYSVLYFQSKLESCRMAAMAGISDTKVSSPPASSNRTVQLDTSVNRLATTAPADPAPMIMKS